MTVRDVGREDDDDEEDEDEEEEWVLMRIGGESSR